MTPMMEIYEMLNQLFLPQDQIDWLVMPNPLLQGRTPYSLIADGEQDEVIRVLSMLCDGAFA